MLSVIWFGVVVCVSLLFLIGVHEYGHYVMAKAFSVPVERFVISPLGGFVRIKKGFVFESLSLIKRAMIILAGPVFNLLFAFLAYYIVFVVGIVQPAPIIGKILPHSLAASAGLVSGSEILAIDNTKTATWAAVVFKVLPHLGEKNTLQIDTTAGKFSLPFENFTLDPVRPNLLLALGIIPQKNSKTVLRKFSAAGAVVQSLREVWLYLWVNGVVVSKMLTGHLSIKSLVGPVGLLSGSFFAAKQGVVIYLAFLGFISVSLAFINLLPIPGLDGSQLLYLAIELFRGRPLSPALQMLLLRLGIILLTVLMIQALMNDVLRLL